MSSIVDYENPKANMYGCLPCPKCGSKHRAVFGSKRFPRIECDECRFHEKVKTTEAGGDDA